MARVVPLLFLMLVLGHSMVGWAAQTAYVSDELRVGVREAPGRKSAPIAIVRSGDVVEVLKRQRGYLKIRTRNGVEGWVKSAYITSKPPTATKLAARVKDLTILKERLAEIEAKTATVNDRLAAMQRRIDGLQQEKDSLQTQLAQARRQLQEAQSLPTIARFTREIEKRPWWLVIVGGLIMFLAAGFLVGVYWYRHQVSKRLGGFTI